MGRGCQPHINRQIRIPSLICNIYICTRPCETWFVSQSACVHTWMWAPVLQQPEAFSKVCKCAKDQRSFPATLPPLVCVEKESGHFAVAIATELLSGHLDSSVITRESAWETDRNRDWVGDVREWASNMLEKLSQKMKSGERVRVEWERLRREKSEFESKGE